MWRKIPASLVFYPVALFAAATAALTYLRGERFISFAAGAAVLIVVVQLVNEKGGFYRSRQMRRAYEARRTFTNIEVVILFALLLANLYVIALVWLT